MYDIEINYTTVNSFGREQEIEMLCNPVTDLNDAKENLKRIKEHYIECRDNPNCGKEYELALRVDHGERTITPFWIGYFETLHGAKILADDMGFELDNYCG